MISNLTITGFRAFRELRVDPLTRVNLFVGKNNAGKTSILEAVELIALGTPNALTRSLSRRGEEVALNDEELDPSHLFQGHKLNLGRIFLITAEGEATRWIECKISHSPNHGDSGQPSLFGPEDIQPSSILGIVFKSHTTATPRFLPLSVDAGLPQRRLNSFLPSEEVPVNFMGTELVGAFRLGQLWDSLVLTPEEQEVIRALRIIEPGIERIAFLSENRRSLGSIFFKHSGSDQRLPLGSFGDGAKRLLALTLNLLSARRGFLLVDEIDTGIHHTVLMDMWKLVIQTAKRLDVQVFATTHSLDCVHALAWVQEQNPDLAAEVTLHRVEKDAPATIVYSMDEIAIAERGQIEVR